MAVSTAVARKRGRVTGLSRSVRNGERPADDGVLDAAKRDLALELLAERAQKIVAEWPDITDEQVDRIATILRGGANG